MLCSGLDRVGGVPGQGRIALACVRIALKITSRYFQKFGHGSGDGCGQVQVNGLEQGMVKISHPYSCKVRGPYAPCAAGDACRTVNPSGACAINNPNTPLTPFGVCAIVGA